MTDKEKTKIETQLNNLYKSIWANDGEYTDGEKSEANKVAFFYQCTRMTITQATFRLTLIVSHQSEKIYDEKYLTIFDSMGE